MKDSFKTKHVLGIEEFRSAATTLKHYAPQNLIIKYLWKSVRDPVWSSGVSFTWLRVRAHIKTAHGSLKQNEKRIQ